MNCLRAARGQGKYIELWVAKVTCHLCVFIFLYLIYSPSGPQPHPHTHPPVAAVQLEDVAEDENIFGDKKSSKSSKNFKVVVRVRPLIARELSGVSGS